MKLDNPQETLMQHLQTQGMGWIVPRRFSTGEEDSGSVSKPSVDLTQKISATWDHQTAKTLQCWLPANKRQQQESCRNGFRPYTRHTSALDAVSAPITGGSFRLMEDIIELAWKIFFFLWDFIWKCISSQRFQATTTELGSDLHTGLSRVVVYFF